jgi:hypothetical protein
MISGIGNVSQAAGPILRLIPQIEDDRRQIGLMKVDGEQCLIQPRPTVLAPAV